MNGVLEQQIRRMLADPRTHELVKNFAGQWLQLRVMQSSTPEGIDYPDFDDNLRQAFRTEAEMFFESIVREDRSIIDLLNGDYTFVNERLAAHYGIPNVYGSQFRRVKLDGDLDVRRGLLGKGGVELVTSVSDRTSPVQRGKWVMTNILGVVPPDPPPNVPALKEAAAGGAGPQTMRQQMEAHRANPACAGCHKMMDPIGFALENFDGIGKWRTKDAGQKVDASGQLDRWHEDRGRGGFAQRAAALFAAVCADGDGKASDLCAGTRRGVSGHAGGARDRAGCRAQRLPFLGADRRHREERAVPDESETGSAVERSREQ